MNTKGQRYIPMSREMARKADALIAARTGKMIATSFEDGGFCFHTPTVKYIARDLTIDQAIEFAKEYQS